MHLSLKRTEAHATGKKALTIVNHEPAIEMMIVLLQIPTVAVIQQPAMLKLTCKKTKKKLLQFNMNLKGLLNQPNLLVSRKPNLHVTNARETMAYMYAQFSRSFQQKNEPSMSWRTNFVTIASQKDTE
jgi:hypothetical protein